MTSLQNQVDLITVGLVQTLTWFCYISPDVDMSYQMLYKYVYGLKMIVHMYLGFFLKKKYRYIISELLKSFLFCALMYLLR